MSGLETAIRNALEKSDRSNAEVRARIYQSSRQALEAGLRKQGIDDPQIVAQQRQRLESLIHLIENEERNRLLDRVEQQLRPPLQESAAQDDDSVDPVSQPPHADEVAVEPELRGETRDARPGAATAPESPDQVGAAENHRGEVPARLTHRLPSAPKVLLVAASAAGFCPAFHLCHASGLCRFRRLVGLLLGRPALSGTAGYQRAQSAGAGAGRGL